MQSPSHLHSSLSALGFWQLPSGRSVCVFVMSAGSFPGIQAKKAPTVMLIRYLMSKEVNLARNHCLGGVPN